MKNGRRRVATTAAAAALLAIGYLLGGGASATPAFATDPYAPEEDMTDFGLAVPKDGFAVVRAPDGTAYVVSRDGRAVRVLVNIMPSSPDAPRQGSSAQLMLR